MNLQLCISSRSPTSIYLCLSIPRAVLSYCCCYCFCRFVGVCKQQEEENFKAKNKYNFEARNRNDFQTKL